MKLKLFILPLILCSCLRGGAQDVPESKTGSWVIYNQNTKLRGSWSLFTDIQLRNYRLTDDQSNWLLRQGITYHFQPAVSVTAGYAYITYHLFDKDDETSNKPTVKEHRLWQQLMLNQKWNATSVQHRYRTEQRWLQSGSNGNAFQHRVRYRILFQQILSDHPLKPYLAAYDEVFLALTSQPFDQNRLYGGAGIFFSKNIKLETGFLLQSFSNHIHYKRIAISLFTDIDAFR